MRRLQSSAIYRLGMIEDAALDAMTSGSASGVKVDAALSHCTVELHNLWHGFSRALYLSAAFRARDGAGVRLTLSKVSQAQSVDEALTHAIRRCKPRKRVPAKPAWTWFDEPSWAKVANLLDSLDAIGSSNTPHVSAALSATPSVFEHVNAFRNFYAHRNEQTAGALRPTIIGYGLPSDLHATEVLLSHAIAPGGSRPQPVILDWISDVRSTLEQIV